MLPVWVKFPEYEQARFVNQALRGMWPYLDTVICSAIKEHVEPIIQDHLPFAISGFTFEKLSFGDHPFHVQGVKHAALFQGVHEQMMLTLDVDATWVALPDVVVKLMPSKKWKWSQMDIRPAMYIKMDYLQVEGRLRLSFPLMNTLPIFSGMCISFLERPKIDLAVKMLGGVDLMSTPALQSWLTSLVTDQVAAAMTFPSRIDVSFISGETGRHAAEGSWPSGVAVAHLHTGHLPPGCKQLMYPSIVVRPPAGLGAAHRRDVHAVAGPLITDPSNCSNWQWQTAVPVHDASQV